MKKIILTGKYALNRYILIDNEDFIKVSKSTWWFNGHYAVATIKQKNIYLHRFLLNALPRQIIEHLNGNVFDNRRSNLIVSNQTYNNHRQFLPHKGKKRGVNGEIIPKGIQYLPHMSKKNPWYVSIQHKNKRNGLGYFPTMELAENAYKKRKEYILKNFLCKIKS